MPAQFFLWLILNVLHATAAQQNNTFSYAQWVIKMAWYGDAF
jgi:hypothetical protein